LSRRTRMSLSLYPFKPGTWASLSLALCNCETRHQSN
jgi:hypothetical protein